MKTFSLRTLIDDILLIVRNNNISESEDFSRAHIASWIMSYKAALLKLEADNKDANGDDDEDDSLTVTLGPLELIDDEDDPNSNRKKTVLKIPTLNNSADDVISVHDAEGCVILYMHQMRRHYHYFRRYTWLEPTCWFDDGCLYLEGGGIQNLKYIYVTVVSDPELIADSEDDVLIPGWMIPQIRKNIMANELAFMLNRPSDDSNNSTLASVKPHGPQDKEE